MDKTPPEILEQITEHLIEAQNWHSDPYYRRWDARLSPFASISRAWQGCIERLTFRYLRVATDELDTFATLFSGRNISRLANISILHISFILPPPRDPLGCCSVVRIPDREADSAMFSESMARLFNIMADLGARTKERHPFRLCFWDGLRQSRFQEPKGWELVPCSNQGYHSRRKVIEAETLSGQYELVEPNALPILKGVATLEYFGTGELEDLNSSWIPRVVEQLPDLQILRLRMRDDYEYGQYFRRLRRQSFSTAICSLAICQLREIRLSIEHTPMRNENLLVHNLIGNKWSEEHWSSIFTHLASFPNLAKVHLVGALVICPEFFRGILEHPDNPFPNLVELELHFAPETADGRWYYERDDEAIESSQDNPKYKDFWEDWYEDHDSDEEEQRDDDESNYIRRYESGYDVDVFEDGPQVIKVVRTEQFRSLPNVVTLAPFLSDASKAISRIPTIRKFILKLQNSFPHGSDLTYYPIVSRVFELWFLKAGTHRSPLQGLQASDVQALQDAAYINQNRLYWRVDHWKP